jgi:general secretion pathway protein G
VKADLQALDTTLGTFAMKNGGDYPDSLDRLVEEDGNGKRYLAQTVVPKDPWGNVYGYNPPDGNSDFELICYGKDGVPGGEGDNRDLSYQDVIDGTE